MPLMSPTAPPKAHNLTVDWLVATSLALPINKSVGDVWESNPDHQFTTDHQRK
eukprot:CAMPEP_0179002430 /NCGR_PEP_ID=MMETSP0795-20121207/12011_1 /TAXON_ID=88552 /ORGANISM="Amoebophrya sp., Strain Ameob2" /LENGTH=52 /DNA_ID=CAMNT_0020696113 /DNA_START=536 /DNA_END=694 /DNA_ORIENTATION=+